MADYILNSTWSDIDAAKGLADAAQASIDAHNLTTNNPHAVTKDQIGLGNVDNTSDADKQFQSLFKPN